MQQVENTDIAHQSEIDLDTVTMKVTQVCWVLVISVSVCCLGQSADGSKQQLGPTSLLNFTLKSYENGLYLKAREDDCSMDGVGVVEHFVETSINEDPGTLWEIDTDEIPQGYRIRNILSNGYLIKGLGSGRINNQASTFPYVNAFCNDALYRWTIELRLTTHRFVIKNDKTEEFLVSDGTGVYLDMHKATEFDIFFQ